MILVMPGKIQREGACEEGEKKTKNKGTWVVFNILFVNYFAGNKNVLIFASRFKEKWTLFSI
jgi:hypothetical protein